VLLENGWDDAEHLKTLSIPSLQRIAREANMKQGHVSKFVTHFHPQPAGQGAEVDLPGEGSQKHAPRALAPGIR
jgi:hypothetical protein